MRHTVSSSLTEMEARPRHWGLEVLATGPSGKSLKVSLKIITTMAAAHPKHMPGCFNTISAVRNMAKIWVLLSSPFYRGGNSGPDKLNNLPFVTQLVSNGGSASLMRQSRHGAMATICLEATGMFLIFFRIRRKRNSKFRLRILFFLHLILI